MEASMSTSEYSVEIADSRVLETEIKHLRTSVFVIEQGVPPDIEWDGLDEQCKHIVVRVQGDCIATGRLMPSGKLGRIAVDVAFRGRGFGKIVTEALCELAANEGLLKAYLHAQIQAKHLYLACGFSETGATFQEANIDHIKMVKSLNPSDTTITQSSWLANKLTLIDGIRRSGFILMEHLHDEFSLYHDLVPRIMPILRSSREAKLHLVTCDIQAIIERQSPFIDWLQRVDSRVSIRVASPALMQRLGDCIAIDGFYGMNRTSKGFRLFRGDSPTYREIRSLALGVWENSTPDPRIKRLHI
jgi:predicted GNAT family N-acyltransferase